MEALQLPGPPHGPPVGALLYRPHAATGPLPALLWIHGGGYVVGSAAADDLQSRHLASEVGCAVLAVDYRLAPESPHPAPLLDCYAALQWLHGPAAARGIDTARLAVAGLSAGGGLAATVAQLACDRGDIPLLLQVLLQPMLDDRPAAPHPTAGEFAWTAATNRFCWDALLDHGGATAAHSAAVRAATLDNLAPAYISVGALDLLAEEDIDYARRLMRAGVPTELHVYPGACHGFYSIAPQAAVARQHWHDVLAALRRTFYAAT